jgi:cystathionine beta-lyase/cystathionine gamma-synthase
MTNNKENQRHGLGTIAVHGGERDEASPFGAVIAPIFRSVSYGFATFDEMRRYARGELQESFFYSRYANPTVDHVERKIAELEGAESAVVTSSGSAATFCAVAAVCSVGDEIIASDSLYGGTTKILTQVFARFGISTRFISIEEIPRLPEIVGPKTKAFWFETPTNPINRVVDLDQTAESACKANLFSIVDNTFATPILQRPLAHGINAVMHSATKYFGGHSDVTAGAVVGPNDYVERVRRAAVLIGTTLDPSGAYFLERGLKTLELRVRATCNNALHVAQFLKEHPNVIRVHYPGLEESPNHLLAKRQMNGLFGGIVAFDLKGNENEAEKFFDSLQMIRSAPSLGGVESLASYPLYSSHVGFSDEQLKAAGVSASTIRLAIGIETVEDIIADLRQALDQTD